MAYAIKVKVRYRSDNTGRGVLLPALLTDNGLLISHIRYLAANLGKSSSWQERSVFSLNLLIRYINANQGLFAKTTDLLRAFVSSLTSGTIDNETLQDPSELFWTPRRLDDASTILSHITSYTDWLSEQEGAEHLRANPFRKATNVEERLNWCAYYHRQSHVFLNHLVSQRKDFQRLKYVREVRMIGLPVVNVEEVKRFPESQIERFLEFGLIRPNAKSPATEHQRVDYKNQAMVTLMHYGGLRLSEVLQLYLSDVVIDPVKMEAIVRVYHPSQGGSPDPKYATRKDYLAKQYQLIPRDEYPKSRRLHLGWKAPLLSDRRGFFQVLFFPPEQATVFLMLWRNYLAYQRKDPLEENANHPYAFTNNKGDPETVKNFQRMHRAAVRRIGLDPDKYSGTSPHGHRHSYGYRLANHGFNQIEIQKAMHHKSRDSCLVYIQPADSEIMAKMRRVEV